MCSTDNIAVKYKTDCKNKAINATNLFKKQVWSLLRLCTL